jgi:hypothetical protein
MASRKPNLAAAGADFGFAVLALVLGWIGTPLAGFALCLLAAMAAWASLRWPALSAMALSTRLTNTALALLMIGAVLGVAYWLGLALGGHN